MSAGPAAAPIPRRDARRWLIVTLGLLLVIAAHAAWDYAEARRLRDTIDRLRATGSPITEWEANPHGPADWPDPGHDAAPYYTAAAALGAAGPAVERNTFNAQIVNSALDRRLQEAIGTGAVSADLLSEVRERLNVRQEALTLLDHATALDFKGFGPGTDYGYRWSHLLELLRLCGLRTAYLALTGDAGAAASLTAEIRLFGGHDRPIEVARRTGLFANFWQPSTISRLELLLNRTKPSEESLRSLADALAAADEDDRFARILRTERATTIEAALGGYANADFGGYGIGGVFVPHGATRTLLGLVGRPVMVHVLRRRLMTYGKLEEAARAPWPERIDRVNTAARTDHRDRFAWISLAEINLSDFEPYAFTSAQCRSARVMIAVERYRRARGALPSDLHDLIPTYLEAIPTDPFSGKAIRYRQVDGGYVAYSVGHNRRDDGGQTDNLKPRLDVPDIGLRVARH